MLREYMHAKWFHGKDGLGDHNYPAPRRAPDHTHAVEAIIEIIPRIRALGWSRSVR
jgi:purine nucleosidase